MLSIPWELKKNVSKTSGELKLDVLASNYSLSKTLQFTKLLMKFMLQAYYSITLIMF